MRIFGGVSRCLTNCRENAPEDIKGYFILAWGVVQMIFIFGISQYLPTIVGTIFSGAMALSFCNGPGDPCLPLLKNKDAQGSVANVLNQKFITWGAGMGGLYSIAAGFASIIVIYCVEVCCLSNPNNCLSNPNKKNGYNSIPEPTPPESGRYCNRKTAALFGSAVVVLTVIGVVRNLITSIFTSNSICPHTSDNLLCGDYGDRWNSTMLEPIHTLAHNTLWNFFFSDFAASLIINLGLACLAPALWTIVVCCNEKTNDCYQKVIGRRLEMAIFKASPQSEYTDHEMVSQSL